MKTRRLIVIMGPAGSGKSALTSALAEKTGWPMIEADDHHTCANRTKMASGHPLTDLDRVGWLDALCAEARAAPSPVVLLACSALTPYVQQRLRLETGRKIRWLLLDVPRQILQERLAARTGHFMPASQLDNQLSALAPPAEAMHLRGAKPLAHLIDDALDALNENTQEHGYDKSCQPDKS